MGKPRNRSASTSVRGIFWRRKSIAAIGDSQWQGSDTINALCSSRWMKRPPSSVGTVSPRRRKRPGGRLYSTDDRLGWCASGRHVFGFSAVSWCDIKRTKTRPMMWPLGFDRVTINGRPREKTVTNTLSTRANVLFGSFVYLLALISQKPNNGINSFTAILIYARNIFLK